MLYAFTPNEFCLIKFACLNRRGTVIIIVKTRRLKYCDRPKRTKQALAAAAPDLSHGAKMLMRIRWLKYKIMKVKGEDDDFP